MFEETQEQPVPIEDMNFNKRIEITYTIGIESIRSK